MTKEQQIFVLADQTLLQVVQQITDNQWQQDATTIPSLGSGTPTLYDIVNRHAYDESWLPDTLAGKTISEVGTKYDGDLLGDEPRATFAQLTQAGIAAVEAVAADDMSKIVHLSYGDFPIIEYLKHITIFRGFRAYTIAKFIGVDSTLPADLVQGLWDEIVPEVEQWRTIGVFGPAIEVADDADLQTKLLGITGFLQQ